jgi:hypothetical protein
MRTFKIVGALLAVLALTAVAAATASAEVVLWKFLPGKVGETFKGESGKAKLQAKGSASIECKKSETKAKEGELLEEGATEGKDATLALAFIHFSGCTSAGLAVKSDGDSSGIILDHLEIHSCTLSGGRWGLLIATLPVHIEVVATGLLFVVTGNFVSELVAAEGPPSKKWNLNINQTEGKQEIESCEGGTAQSLQTAIDGGANIQSGEAAKEGAIEFEKEAQTAMT